MHKIQYLIPVLVGLGIISSCDSGSGSELNGSTRSDVLAVDYVVAQPQPAVNSIKITGTLIPAETARLTTQSEGKVQSILFEEGQQVKKGQILVRIDNRESQAQLQRSQAQLETALKDLERKRALAKIQGISDAELEAAELQTQTLQANIEETKVRLDHATIRAPFDGKIGLRSVSPGSYITSGSSVATLVQEDPLKLQFNVPERYASQLRVGQQVRFTVAGRDEIYEAEVYATEPMINEATRALQVRAKTDNPDGALIPGSYADVVLTLDSIPDALLIPTEAIIPRLNDQLVFRITNGKAEEVTVKTGVRQPSIVQITSGIKPGDSIMVSGLLQVKPGMAVKGDKEIEVETFENNQ